MGFQAAPEKPGQYGGDYNETQEDAYQNTEYGEADNMDAPQSAAGQARPKYTSTTGANRSSEGYRLGKV